MTHDVFISYSSKDKSVADAACHALEARGIRCWIAPRDIQVGADWSDQIIGALDESGALVLVFSSHANESRQVKRELTYAADREIPILPLRIENVLPIKGFRYYLGDLHWLDALSPPLEMHLERLTDRVSALLLAGSKQSTKPGEEVTTEREEEESLRQYREAVEWAWADEKLDWREAERLKDLTTRLRLSLSSASEVEREVMGETIEVILQRQEQARWEEKEARERRLDNEFQRHSWGGSGSFPKPDFLPDEQKSKPDFLPDERKLKSNRPQSIPD